jgi:4-amino-4-deoxy-L-arabinose transferase-like glycosyltransferase
MIAIVVAVLLACLIYYLVALITGSAILAIVAAILVLLVGIAGAHGRGGRV